MNDFEVIDIDSLATTELYRDARVATIATGMLCASIVITDIALRSKAFELMFRLGEFDYI